MQLGEKIYTKALNLRKRFTPDKKGVTQMDETMKNTEKGYFVGEPIPLSELKIQERAPKYPWLSILKGIPEGHAQEVKISFASCKRAIENFVKSGRIKKDEFEVRSKTGDRDKRRVFILHHGPKRK